MTRSNLIGTTPRSTFSRSSLTAASFLLLASLLTSPATLAAQATASVHNSTESIVGESVVFLEKGGMVAVEAEHFSQQNLNGPRQWHVISATSESQSASLPKPDPDPSHARSASGGAYLELLPDTRRTQADKLTVGENFQPTPGNIGRLDYKVHFATAGRYYVWARAFSTGNEDNGIHVGIDGTWPEHGQRLQWCDGKNSWRWESKQRTDKQHCGVAGEIYLDVDKPGLHTISFCMREDGFEFDRWIMTADRNFARPADNGPATALHSGELPQPFEVQDEKRPADGTGDVVLTGEMKKWHKVTVTLDGPTGSENDMALNPFLDRRMTCTFTHASGSPTYAVPGYFAADGNAAETSAKIGTSWRCHFAPDKVGKWNYEISFVEGQHIAITPDDVGKAIAPFDEKSGSFEIAATDKTGRDFRALGRLSYVGEHYLQTGETKQWFVKAGPDAPETLLAFADFDDTFARKPNASRVKTWGPHVQDWREGEPTWQNRKGKGLIGAINYLASKKLNAFSFLTYNVGGDGHNVWPHISDAKNDRLRFDCSKLDQWAIVIDHAQAKGLLTHIKLQETENDDRNHGHKDKTGDVPAALDGGEMGVERTLYLRELVARFGHAPALEWNLGEENTQTPGQQKAMANYLNRIDAYAHPVVLHTFPQEQAKRYEPMLGNQSTLTGASLQNMWDMVHHRTLHWVKASADSGRKWVVVNDEQGTADQGVPPDPGYDGFDGTVTMKKGRTYDLHDIRKQTLWGNLMAGGAGVNYYFGYKLKQSDLVCEDFRSRDKTWDYCGIALDFFYSQQLPLDRMRNENALIGNKDNKRKSWCLAEPNQAYLLYLADGKATELDMTAAKGSFSAQWFNPRSGGSLTDAPTSIEAPCQYTLPTPPADPNQDWVLLVKRTQPLESTATAAPAGQETAAWQTLFDENYTHWEKWLGVPHKTVKDLPDGPSASDDGKTGTPLGLNNDPKNVFSMSTVDGEPVLHVTGEVFGGLTTLKEYSDYHLRLQFKWGEKKWEPRLNQLRDAGILYHCVGEHGAFWNVWMQCLECQIQEGDYGDLFLLQGTSGSCRSAEGENQKRIFAPAGETVRLGRGSKQPKSWVCRRSENAGNEGEWNTVEVLAIGDRAIHVVNGKVVNEVFDAKCTLDGKQQRLAKGKIQLQSEAAEIDYRRCEIKPITEFPQAYLDQLAPAKD